MNNLGDRIRAVAANKTGSFLELVELSGLDPANDFRHMDMRGFDFSNCDLSGFDLRGSDIEGSNFDGSKIIDVVFDGKQVRLNSLKQSTDYADFINRFSTKRKKQTKNDVLHLKFIEQCYIGDINAVQHYIDCNVNVNFVPHHYEMVMPALMTACLAKHYSIAELLLDRGADVNLKDASDGKNALMSTCSTGDISLVELLCMRGAKLNQRSKNGVTSPLNQAILHKNNHLIKQLAQRGARINYVSGKFGQTALCTACLAGNLDAVKQLIELDGIVNKPSKLRGESPLINAIENGNRKIIKYLIDMDADVNQTNNYGVSPLMKACSHQLDDVVFLLLGSGARTNSRSYESLFFVSKSVEHLLDRSHIKSSIEGLIDPPIVPKHWKKGCSALHIAALTGSIKIIGMLIKSGAEIDLKTELEEVTPLSLACFNSKYSAAKLLIKNGADVNHFFCNGYLSPLIIATKHNDFKIAKLLIESGADVNKENPSEISSFIVAKHHRFKELIELQIKFSKNKGFKNSSDYDPAGLHQKFLNAYRIKDKKSTKNLLSLGLKLKQVEGNFGIDTFLIASAHGDISMIEKFLTQEFGINTLNVDKESALMVATNCQQHDTVQFLLENGADVNIKDILGWNSLFIAVQRKNIRIAKLLVKFGIDINYYDKFGSSAFEIAFNESNYSMIQFLITNGFHVKKKDKYGKNFIDKARKSSDKKLAKLIK